MTEKEIGGKVEEEKKPKSPKPPGWRNFQKVLKVVVKAPPMRKSSLNPISEQELGSH